MGAFLSVCYGNVESVDLYHNLLVLADSCGASYGADRLRDSALLADDSAHIALCHVDVVNDSALFIRFINSYANRSRIFNETLSNSKK